MKRFHLKFFLYNVLFTSLLGGLIFSPVPVAAAQSGDMNSSICIVTAPDALNFPDVALEFRAIDQHYQAIPGINSNSIEVLDNNALATINNLVSNANGVGADIYFVIDQGNRTDQTVIRAALKRFGEKFMVDGKDRVTIITNLEDPHRNNPRVYLPLTNSIADFLSAVNNLPLSSDNVYLSAYGSYVEALNQIRGDSAVGCSRPRFLVSFMGEDELNQKEVNSISALAIQLQVPVHVVHVKRYNSYRDSDIYEPLAVATYGIYQQVERGKDGDFTQLDPGIFTALQASHQSYSLQFRTSEGTSGSHTVNLQWEGQPAVAASGTAEYTVNLAAPGIVLSTPVEGSVIERMALQQTENGHLYDVDTQTVQFQVDWPDGLPRSLTSAELQVQTQIGTETVATVAPSNLSALSFEWDLRELSLEGDYPVSLQVKVIDELGFSTLSQPVNVIVRNTIPVTMASPISDPFTRYTLIGLGALVIILLVLVAIFWRRLSKLASSGVVGQVVNQVRKTILGGVRRGKPIATLKVVDGPTTLVGKELSIYVETVKLGRDPAQADFSFYENANSSISGLHAKLEKVNGLWRIVAISRSGQETFVDEEPLPMMEPIPIRDGQVIRLGYPAQQCVELEFHSTAAPEVEKSTESARETVYEDIPEKPGRTTKVYDDRADFDLPTISKEKQKEENYDDFFQSLRGKS